MADINPAKLNELLGTVSRKLGVSQEKLRSELEAGKFDSALKNMTPSDAAVFNRLLSNPQMLDKFMNTPQALALYKKLTGSK